MSPIKGAPRAGVAQLVEQRTCNAKVEGSTPFSGTILADTYCRWLYLERYCINGG